MDLVSITPFQDFWDEHLIAHKPLRWNQLPLKPFFAPRIVVLVGIWQIFGMFCCSETAIFEYIYIYIIYIYIYYIYIYICIYHSVPRTKFWWSCFLAQTKRNALSSVFLCFPSPLTAVQQWCPGWRAKSTPKWLFSELQKSLKFKLCGVGGTHLSSLRVFHFKRKVGPIIEREWGREVPQYA